MADRRDMLSRALRLAGALAAAGVWPEAAKAQATTPAGPAFEARSLAAVLKALGHGLPTESREVSLSAPDIAENGAAVALAASASASLPGLKRLLLLVEANPAMLTAVFDVSDAVEPSVAIRAKMVDSSAVYAVALLADGRALYAVKDVKVTIGGCGA